MAQRFWVKRGDLGSIGSGVWGATQRAHWAATSGGVGGQTVPTSVDNVWFDNHSGTAAAVITVDGPMNCNSLTIQSTFAGKIAATSDGSVRPFGNIVLNGKDIDCPVRVMDTCIINSGGGKFLKYLNIQPNTTGHTTTIQGALEVATILYLRASTLLTAGNNITCSAFTADTEVFPAALNMGSGGTWTITGAGDAWTVNPGIPITNTAGTIIKFTDESATTKTISGGSAIYGTLRIEGAGTGLYQFTLGNNTFANIVIATPPHTLVFSAGSLQTISTAAGLQVSGEADKRNVLKSSAPDSDLKWGISVAAGDVRVEYVSIQDSAAQGGAKFLANSSINVGGNTGWRFNANEQFFSVL